MDIFVDDDEVIEKLIKDQLPKEDRSEITIVGETQGKREEGKDNLTKKIIAIDALQLGPSKASEIHDVTKSSASKYKDGKDIADDDTRAEVLSIKHNVASVATAKLMEALDLFDPNTLQKQTDIIKSASMLAGIVEKVSIRGNQGNEIHLHMYAPKQRKIEQYEVIEVS